MRYFGILVMIFSGIAAPVFLINFILKPEIDMAKALGGAVLFFAMGYLSYLHEKGDDEDRAKEDKEKASKWSWFYKSPED